MNHDATHGSLSEWTTAVTRELGLEGAVEGDSTMETISELASHVTDGVDVAAAPITAHLVGVAAGRAEDPAVATRDFAQKIAHLAQGWTGDEERGVPADDQSTRA